MMKFIKGLGAAVGISARAFVVLIGIAGISTAAANYFMTVPGGGTPFGSAVVSTVHYAQQLICDFTAPSTNCAAVKAANTVTSTDVGLVVAVANTLTAGQKTMAGSSPIVIASDQSQVPSTPGTLAGGAKFVSGTTAAMTATTSTSVIPLVAAERIYVMRIKCNNTSSTATLVQIRDGSAGTVLDTLAAGATYGGEQGTGSTPLFWTTAGTALFAQNVTTGASVICTASGYSG
jgi:hypothetical protein